ncbi:MAG: hypothetical protein LDLANPLL_00363 [Turneriella sp.]|nr:hypothetical protein [Turneriella sp.]
MNMAKVSTRRTDLKKKGTVLTKLRKLAEKVPASELAKLPVDGSVNYKHYLYGHPKK